MIKIFNCLNWLLPLVRLFRRKDALHTNRWFLNYLCVYLSMLHQEGLLGFFFSS